MAVAVAQAEVEPVVAGREEAAAAHALGHLAAAARGQRHRAPRRRGLSPAAHPRA